MPYSEGFESPIGIIKRKDFNKVLAVGRVVVQL